MLPNEEKHVAEINKHLANEFGYAQTLLAAAVRLVDSRCECRDCEPVTISAAIQLQVGACRKFRQVIALCQLGQGSGAEIVARSLFETMLAQAFVCAPNIEFRNSPSEGKIRFTKEIEGDRFRRGKLYFAYQDVKYTQWLEGLRKEIPVMQEWADEQLARPSHDWDNDPDVGGEWTRRFKTATTCAGLTVSQLAASAGDKIYSCYVRSHRAQSAFVHPSWGGGYTDMMEGELGSNIYWIDKDSAIASPLYVGGLSLVLGSLFFASIRVDFEERKKELDSAMEVFHEICYRFESELPGE